MPDIVIHLRADAQLPEELLGYGVAPLYPGSTDTGLRTVFHLPWPYDGDPADVVRAFLRMPGVEAAYVKEPGDMP